MLSPKGENNFIAISTGDCYSVVNKIIDRLGENININPIDDDHFSITAPVMACSTFYSWVFNYGGKIKIVSPVEVKDEFTNIIKSFINS